MPHASRSIVYLNRVPMDAFTNVIPAYTPNIRQKQSRGVPNDGLVFGTPGIVVLGASPQRNKVGPPYPVIFKLFNAKTMRDLFYELSRS